MENATMNTYDITFIGHMCFDEITPLSRGCPKRKFNDKKIQYIEINPFDKAIYSIYYCISY
jgi:hypothetical protein